jgi:hypothetical protein
VSGDEPIKRCMVIWVSFNEQVMTWYGPNVRKSYCQKRRAHGNFFWCRKLKKPPHLKFLSSIVITFPIFTTWLWTAAVYSSVTRFLSVDAWGELAWDVGKVEQTNLLRKSMSLTRDRFNESYSEVLSPLLNLFTILHSGYHTKLNAFISFNRYDQSTQQ